MLIKSPNPKTLRGKSDKEEGDASAAILHAIQMLTKKTWMSRQYC